MADAQVAHMVYFKLKDDSESAVAAQVAACHKYLAGHDGTVYFSVGLLATDLKREVNDHGFDVALHVVFADREAHDAYQSHERHIAFIEENRGNWNSVRVFDSYV